MDNHATVESALIRGLEAVPVRVGVDIEYGKLPALEIEGVGHSFTAREMRSRVRCALTSSEFIVPRGHVRVRIDPEVQRSVMPGATDSLALPIAAGVLAASGQIPSGWLDDVILSGDLSLDGAIEPSLGIPIMQELAQAQRKTLIVSAAGSRSPLGPIDGVRGASSIADLRSGMDGMGHLRTMRMTAPGHEGLAMDGLSGNEGLRRAMVIAAAGNHGMSVEMGKDSSISAGDIAQALARIMGGASHHDVDVAAKIASLDPLTKDEFEMRPVRRISPEGTLAGVVGGGRPVRPGAMSEAHTGILLIDEAERQPDGTLHGIRLAATDGRVSIVRVDGHVSYPTGPLVLAALRIPEGSSERVRDRLERRLDFLPIRTSVEDAPRSAQPGQGTPESVAEMAAQVAGAKGFAREMAAERQVPDADAPAYMKVARTIADLDRQIDIGERHIEEAMVLMDGPRASAQQQRDTPAMELDKIAEVSAQDTAQLDDGLKAMRPEER